MSEPVFWIVRAACAWAYLASAPRGPLHPAADNATARANQGDRKIFLDQSHGPSVVVQGTADAQNSVLPPSLSGGQYSGAAINELLLFR